MYRLIQWLQSFEQVIAGREYVSDTLIRTIRAAGMVVFVFLIGTLGYWFGTDRQYDLLECAYMTVITLTTVGYGEIIPVREFYGMRVFTIVLIALGMGSALYFASSLTAFIVDGELRNLLRMRKMKERIDNLEDHFIVAGVGNTGEYVLDEMTRSQRSCVVIDSSRDRLDEVREDIEYDFPFIVGDATDDAILRDAGVERANGLICSLGSDRDNLFVTISARSHNDDMRIITRGYQPESEEKFKMAGATSVIYTNALGGLRMAAEAVRPQVTTFLELMMQDHGHYRRIEQLDIPDDSPLVGCALREIPLRKHTDALIIAVYEADEDEYHFNPGRDFTLSADSKLIVLTLIEDLETLESIIRGEDHW